MKRTHLFPETQLINTTMSSHFLHVVDQLQLFVTSLVLMVREHQTAQSWSVFHLKGGCSIPQRLIKPPIYCVV